MFNSESNSNQYNCDFDSSEILELKDTILILKVLSYLGQHTS